MHSAETPVSYRLCKGIYVEPEEIAYRKHIVEQGHPLRVYVPFGDQWFAYSTRRLKENPRIASLIIKALFFRG